MTSEEYARTYLNQKFDIHKLLLDSALEKSFIGEEYVINYLAFHDIPVFPKDLCENMNTSSARIAAILRHLENEKLIIIHDDPTDGRRHSVRLNEEGFKAAAEIRKAKMRLLTDIFEKLGEHDSEEYIRITQKIIGICANKGGDN